MRVVVITDRRLGDPRRQLERLISSSPSFAGVAVQIREKDLEGRALLALVRDVMSLGAPVWVNDRVDIARIAGAHGGHLPEAGLAIADARLAGAARIGCSRHDVAGALAAPCELVQLGPIFATPGKGPPLGVDVLGIATTAMLVAISVNHIVMLLSQSIGRLLGRFNIMSALIRITGLIVMTIGTQMALDGLSSWIAGRHL